MSIWNFGGTTITRIEESERLGSMPLERFFSTMDREVFLRHLDWLAPKYYCPDHDRLRVSNHSWLIRTARQTILVDACTGNHKHRPFNPAFHQLETPYLDRLRQAGVSPSDIDVVLCTHLHADHVGWNTMLENGRWVPTFPRARYLFARAEEEYWRRAINLVPENDPANRTVVYEDSVLPIIRAGRAELIDGSFAVEDHLVVEPAPGHTPGHIVLKLNCPDATAIFCGDVVHHPIQICEPDWNTQFCIDQGVARETRRRILNESADNDGWLFPTHFVHPYACKIVKTETSFMPVFHGNLLAAE
jgi:glyoxylase-like metal-dependent hydrolase (beta-lactamase superfamily II)